MCVVYSIIIAFSMYSRLPMPKVEWSEKNMKYVLCAFPLVGIATGAALCAAFWIRELTDIGDLLFFAVVTVLPVMITGGIHLDGYLDTMDAVSSYADREKKLEILKDPNVGSFAVIHAILYFLIYFGIVSEIDERMLGDLVLLFVTERTLSGLGVVLFPMAKNTGLAHMFHDASQKKANAAALAVMLLIETGIYAARHSFEGIVFAAFLGALFVIYYLWSKKVFGGITGDLAGFFLQATELLGMGYIVMFF